MSVYTCDVMPTPAAGSPGVEYNGGSLGKGIITTDKKNATCTGVENPTKGSIIAEILTGGAIKSTGNIGIDTPPLCRFTGRPCVINSRELDQIKAISHSPLHIDRCWINKLK